MITITHAELIHLIVIYYGMKALYQISKKIDLQRKWKGDEYNTYLHTGSYESWEEMKK